MKKVLSLILSLAILLSVTAGIDTFAFAETSVDYKYSVSDDETAEISKYNGSESNLTIPSKLGGYTVTSIGDGAFDGCTSLTNVTIPEGVTDIKASAFYGCTNLKSVTISKSVSDISENPFSGCSSLESITVDENNEYYDSRNNCNAIITKKDTVETDEDGNSYTGKKANTLVAGCKNTEIPNSVTAIGDSAFSGFSGLTDITIPDSVTSLGLGAFSGSGIKSLKIGSGLKSLSESSFGDCPNLESIAVDENNEYFDSRNNCNAIITKKDIVEEDEYYSRRANTLITGCKSTVIPDSVTIIGSYAFSGCTGLTGITIPDSVTEIAYCAFDGSGLKSITIPDSVTIIYDAFNGCKDLTTVKIGKGVSFISGEKCSNAFTYCPSLESITVDTENPYYDSRDNSNAIITKKNITETYNEDGKDYEYTLTEANTLITGCKGTIIPNTVTAIDSCAFMGCMELESITIPDSVTSIRDIAFKDCYKLSTVNIGTGVDYIGGGVFDCISYEYPDGDYDNEIKKYNGNLQDVYLYSKVTGASDKENYYYEDDDDTVSTGSLNSLISSMPAGSTLHAYSVLNAKSICEKYGVKYVALDGEAGDKGSNNGSNQQPDSGQGTTGGNSGNANPGSPSGNQTQNNNQKPATETNPKKPKSSKISKLKKGKKSITLQWKRVKGVSGYQIQYSTSKKMKKAKTKNVKSSKKTKATIKKLKSKKKYYVRIRTYKTVNGKKVYSKWSAKKTVKTK